MTDWDDNEPIYVQLAQTVLDCLFYCLRGDFNAFFFACHLFGSFLHQTDYCLPAPPAPRL